jgi:hypothetical protein
MNNFIDYYKETYIYNMSKIINKEICILKNEIQDLLGKVDIEDENIKNIKNIKIEELKKLNDKYVCVLNKENESKKDMEYKKVCRETDTLTFAKVRNKTNRTEIMTSLKDNREKANNEFYKFKKLEEEYCSVDSKIVPAFLFFNQSIISAYKMCPYIKIDTNKELEIENKRIEWLKNTKDNGEKYYELYNNVINERQFLLNIEIEKNIHDYFENVLSNIFNEKQRELYNLSIDYLIDYIDCNVKTKKIKDKFKIIINNISTLVMETGFLINEYISLKYNIYIPVNTNTDTNIDTNINKNDNNKYKSIFLIEEYNNKLRELQQVKDDIINNRKYITNVKQNLKQELYQYLSKFIHQIEIQVCNENSKNKKWSQLKVEQKTDRFNSFSRYYVSKFLVSSNLITLEDKEKFINVVNKLLNESDPPLKYKELKWDVKSGSITSINNLKWDDNLKNISLTRYVEEEKIKVGQVKRPSLIKTIINKDTEEIMNEEILKFLILKIQSKVKFDLQESKILLIENLKIKLLLKRITVNDKVKIFKKIDDMYNIISLN